MKPDDSIHFPTDKVAHLLITRFNIGFYEAEALYDKDYLERRFEIFAEITIPSVASQTCKDFTFLVLFDPLTPRGWLQRFAALATRTNMQIAMVANDDDIAAVLKPFIPAACEWIITTRLDNDDAISTDFIARVQRAARPLQCCFINLCRGLVYDMVARQLFHRCYLYNPFVSVVETSSNFRGIYAYSHSQIHCHGPVVYDWGPPAFLQSIHGSNSMNRSQGWPLAGAVTAANFGLAAETLAIARPFAWPAATKFRLEETVFVLKQFYHLLAGHRYRNFTRCLRQLFVN